MDYIIYYLRRIIRTTTAIILVPIMKLTGFSFSRDFRLGETLVHRIVYACVDTVGANTWAHAGKK
jgi:hypothetical protein